MARIRLTLDRVGIGQVLRSGPVRRMVADAGQKVAGSVTSRGLVAHAPGQASDTAIAGEVDVRPGVGSYDQRPVTLVTIKHPAAEAMQAKYGVLTQAVNVLGKGASWNPS